MRTSVPAHMAGGPSALPVQNVRVVQSHLAGRTPGAAPGAPGGMQQAEQRPGATPGAAPGQAQRGEQAQARRFGGGPQAGEEVFHCLYLT